PPANVVSHHRAVVLGSFNAFDPFGGGPRPASLRTKLLVATPQLLDPSFARRVVLVLDHGNHGAVGIVLDRPGGLAVDRLFPAWHELATPPAELFTGGPVGRSGVIGLVRLRIPSGTPGDGVPPGWNVVVPGEHPCGTVDLSEDPLPYREAILGARLFSGYSGWSSGQLEEEIADGSWYVVDAEERDPLSADPEGLWRRVLRRQGGALSIVSALPPDPSAN
ncbi:MAG: YqgE/AlgH family protein, partial [Acidimicrobiales bacterium]